MQVNEDGNSGIINQEIYMTSFPKMECNQGVYRRVQKHIDLNIELIFRNILVQMHM